MRRLCGLGLVFATCGMIGCGGDDDDGGAAVGGAGSGGAAASGGSAATGGKSGSGGAGVGGGSGSGGGSGGSAAGPCTADEPSLVLEGVLLDHLTAAGTGVMFIDRTAGSLFPTGHQGGAIRRIDSDGMNDTTLYTAAENRMILSIALAGEAVFFLEDTYNDVLDDLVSLYRLPLSGGVPELIAPLAPLAQTTEMIAVDADSAYINFGEDGLLRVTLAGGTVSTIAADRVLHNAVLVGDDIYYTNSPAIGMTRLSRVAKSATDAVGTVIEGPCNDPLIASSGLFCEGGIATQGTVERFDLTGTGPEVLAMFDEGLRGQVVEADAEHAYYVASDLPSLDGHPLWSVPLDGGAPVAIACDRHELAISDTDGPYPTSRGLILAQVVLNPGEVIWLERRVDDMPPSLYRAAR